MEIYRIAARVIAVFVFLILILRLSGKRTVAQGQPIDFVVALVLGDLVDDAIWAEVPFSQFLAAAGLLTVLHTALNTLAAGSKRVHNILVGEPALIIRKGHPIPAFLHTERINRHEIGSLLRLQGIAAAEWQKIRNATLETNGRVSVALDPSERPAQKRDLAS